MGIVLRYGFLYGPGTVGAEPGDLPSVHVAAAARAAALAVDHGAAGVYNIVDDGERVSNQSRPIGAGLGPGRLGLIGRPGRSGQQIDPQARRVAAFPG